MVVSGKARLVDKWTVHFNSWSCQNAWWSWKIRL